MTVRKKTFLIAGCTIVLGLLVAGTLLLFPNYLFAYHENYKKFDIYSGKPIDARYRSTLDQSLALAGNSEIFDSSYRYDIFMTKGVWYKPFAETLLGPSLARSIDNNILLNDHADFINNELGTSNKRELMQTITHEMVHCLMLHKYGMFRINPLHHPPLWKVEGYPEFIALRNDIYRKDYDLRRTIALLKSFIDRGDEWITIKQGFADPLLYFKARVMMEFLITKKNMTLDQIMDNSVKEDEVYNELIDWYQHKR